MKIITTSLTVAVAAALLLAQTSFAGVISYDVFLNGTNEEFPNQSPGVGFGTVAFDDVAHTMQVDLTFSGLVAPDTGAHIHCCTGLTGNAGIATQVPTFQGFPSGVTFGTYSHVFDMTQTTSFKASFITANGGTAASAEAALIAGAAAGNAYLRIYTASFGNGEIRGFLGASPTATPEPTSIFLTASAFLGLGLLRRCSKGL